jgi:hypothetical protein
MHLGMQHSDPSAELRNEAILMNLTSRFINLSSFVPSSTRFSRTIGVAALTLLALALRPAAGHAQITTDTTHWNDEELYEEDKSAPAFFSVGGGVLGSYFMPNFDDLNANVVSKFGGPAIPNHVWMIGGQGFITVPWVKNLRVGGIGMSGASDCSCTDTTINGSAVGRFLEYHVGYGAVTFDYVLPIRTGRFHIVPGVALGFGSVNLYAQQAQQRTFDIAADFNGTSPNTTHTYSSSFFLYMPQIQFEYAPLGYMMLRLSAGYQGTAMGDWTVDRQVALSNTAPLKNVTGNGMVASLGVFFGIFQ